MNEFESIRKPRRSRNWFLRHVLHCIILTTVYSNTLAYTTIEDFDPPSQWNQNSQGLTPESGTVHQGAGAARLLLEKTTNAWTNSVPGDWTPFSGIEIWAYSESANNAVIGVMLLSQNDQTTGSDYFFYPITVDWSGWKRILIKKGDFKTMRSPLWTDVKSIYFSLSAWSWTVPAAGKSLIVDSIRALSESEVPSGSISLERPVDESINIIGVHWKMNESSGVQATDSSGNNFHGTLFAGGFITPIFQSGNSSPGTIGYGNGISLHGSASAGSSSREPHVIWDGTTNSAAIGLDMLNTDFTLGAWIRLEEVGSQAQTIHVLERGKSYFAKTTASLKFFNLCLVKEAGVNTGWRLRFGCGDSLIADASYTSHHTSTTVFNDRQWHHVAVSFDYRPNQHNVVTFWLDGEIIGNSEVPLNISVDAPNRMFGVGERNVGNFISAFQGQLDDVFVTKGLYVFSNSLLYRKFHYKETTQAPVPTSKMIQQGFIAFKRNYMEHLFINSFPTVNEMQEPFVIYASMGEREPLLMGMRTLRNINDLRVTVGDLSSASGAVLARNNFEVGVIRSIPKRRIYHERVTRDYFDLPILIEPWRSIDLNDNVTQGFWVDLSVPKTAKAGTYRGNIHITSQGGYTTVPLTVVIYPFELKNPDQQFFGPYTRFADLANDPGQIRQQMNDMVANGMTTMGFAGREAIYQVSPDVYGVNSNPIYTTVMSHYRTAGFTQPKLIQLGDAAMIYADKKIGVDGDGHPKPGYASVYWDANQRIFDSVREKNWPMFYMQSLDEPSLHGEADKTKVKALLQISDAQNLIPTEINGPVDSYLLQEAGIYADMVVCNGDVPSNSETSYLQSLGKKVLIYNTDVEAYRHVLARYSSGFLQWKHSLDGLLQWEYQEPASEKTYNEVKAIYPLSYLALVYPPYQNNPGGDTISWKCFREGIDDYRYISTLKDRIASAKLRGISLAYQIEGNLSGILDSLQDMHPIRNNASWSSSGRGADGSFFISGKLNSPNGWALTDYDSKRRSIASWIQQLDVALAQP